MKKLLLMLALACFALSFQSCEDEHIANSLEGTWEGKMYISIYYGGHTYNSTSTKICFERNPFKYTSGSGYWVDHYDRAPWGWNYVANHISWQVENKIIRVDFIEEGTTIFIDRYELSGNFFHGWLNDNGTPVEFRLKHTYSPNWEREYTHWEWNDYYYSKGSNGKTIEKPVRFVRTPEDKQ